MLQVRKWCMRGGAQLVSARQKKEVGEGEELLLGVCVRGGGVCGVLQVWTRRGRKIGVREGGLLSPKTHGLLIQEAGASPDLLRSGKKSHRDLGDEKGAWGGLKTRADDQILISSRGGR